MKTANVVVAEGEDVPSAVKRVSSFPGALRVEEAFPEAEDPLLRRTLVAEVDPPKQRLFLSYCAMSLVVDEAEIADEGAPREPGGRPKWWRR